MHEKIYLLRGQYFKNSAFSWWSQIFPWIANDILSNNIYCWCPVICIFSWFGNFSGNFFQWIGISVISQNNFIVFTKLRRVPPEISAFSTLSFWYCRNLIILLNAHFWSSSPFVAKRLHCSSKFPFVSKDLNPYKNKEYAVDSSIFWFICCCISILIHLSFYFDWIQIEKLISQRAQRCVNCFWHFIFGPE